MHGIITTPKSERVFVEHVFGGGGCQVRRKAL